MISLSPPSLREWLASEGGAVPFRRFMEAALYDPSFGYYSSQIQTVGARGDFSTSATLSSMLARAIAKWIVRTAPEHCRNLIEVGPGNGMLHRALRQALGWRGRWHGRSHLVERSPVLRIEQRRTLGWLGRGVRWHETLAEALQSSGGHALIFSNELVDAFPATLLQFHDSRWQEVWLEITPDGRIVESLRPAHEISPGLSPDGFPEGQRVECHFSYRDWCRAWRPHWRSGAMLTIDYGDIAERLYVRRPHGTVRGYHRHRRLEGLEIYQNPGYCDLTADVNFTDLMDWGRESGMETVSRQSQADFFAQYTRSQSVEDDRLQDLLGAGSAFQCLVQRPVAIDFASPPEA